MKPAFFALLVLAIGASVYALGETRPLAPPTAESAPVMEPRMARVRGLPPTVPGLIAQTTTAPEPAAIARSSMVVMVPPPEPPPMHEEERPPVEDLPPAPEPAEVVEASPAPAQPAAPDEVVGPSDEQSARLEQLVPDEQQRDQISRALAEIPRDRIDQVLSDMPPRDQLDQMLSDLPAQPR